MTAKLEWDSTDSWYGIVDEATPHKHAQMPNMHSPTAHCCCCVTGVFASLLGIILISTGVCIVLNYGIEVDTKVLPKEWQNENGEKIVGIILICCGFVSLVISIVVGSLYFTVCTKSKTQPAVTPQPNSDRNPRPQTRSRSSTTSSRVSISPSVGRKYPKSKKRKITKSRKPGLETHQELCESSLNLTSAGSRKQSLAGIDNPASDAISEKLSKREHQETEVASSSCTDSDISCSNSTSPHLNSTASLQGSAQDSQMATVTSKSGNPDRNDHNVEPLPPVVDLSGGNFKSDTQTVQIVSETEMQTLNVPAT